MWQNRAGPNKQGISQHVHSTFAVPFVSPEIGTNHRRKHHINITGSKLSVSSMEKK